MLESPNTPRALIQPLIDTPHPMDVEAVLVLSRPQIPAEELAKLARYPSPEVRISLARHPAATPDIPGLLATDGTKDIRRLAASHPKTRLADLQLLVRAGSTPDLMALSAPDPAMSTAEIHRLLDGGVWARQLAVRHPNTGADTLAHLLCDGEPKIRERAAVHPRLSPATKRDLIRAGSGSNFQGIAPPDPELPPDNLRQISALGPWGEWVVANNPYAPAELLDSLAQPDDWQVRVFVARNSNTSSATVTCLEKDPVEEVRRAARDRPRGNGT